MKKNLGFVAVLLGTVVVLFLAMMNPASVPFSLTGGASVDVPAGWLVVVGYLLGLAVAWGMAIAKSATGPAATKAAE